MDMTVILDVLSVLIAFVFAGFLVTVLAQRNQLR